MQNDAKFVHVVQQGHIYQLCLPADAADCSVTKTSPM